MEYRILTYHFKFPSYREWSIIRSLPIFFGRLMKILKPCRGDLIATLPLFVKVSPLARPRLNYHNKSVYQPKENQQALLAEMNNFEAIEIAFPIICDTFINFAKGKSKTMWAVAQKYGDEDNLRKAICDAMQDAKIVVDDRFIVGGENYKHLATEDVALIKLWSVEGEKET